MVRAKDGYEHDQGEEEHEDVLDGDDHEDIQDVGGRKDGLEKVPGNGDASYHDVRNAASHEGVFGLD